MFAALILTTLSTALPQEPDAHFEVVRVLDGRVLVGEVVEHDLDGLDVISARNGGHYRLGWADLFPGEAERLKNNFGYRTDSAAPTVTADRLMMVNGQQIIGRILSRDANQITIRTRGNTLVVPTVRLAAPPEKVVVDAIDVMTPEQFYQERLPQIPEDDALEQYRFALELEEVSAYQQAQEHLQAALVLAAGDEPLERRIEGALPRVETAIANKAETEKIKEIRGLMYRDRYAQAEELIEAFREEHSDSPVYDQFLDVIEKFDEERETAMTLYLRNNWYKRAAAMIKKKSIDRRATVESLQNWATSEMPQALRELLAVELQEMKPDLDPGEVESLWRARMETKPKRHQAGYGHGTWILGENRARAGLKDEEEQESDGRTEAEKELQERYRRYLENLERTRQAAGTSEDATPEDWWKNATATARFQWLLAYYAEFSGDFELAGVRFENCPTCSGDGYVESIQVGTGGGQEKRSKCPTCHTVAVRRSLYFR